MQVAAQEFTPTITNLLAAFEGESNAYAKYMAYAAKADADGLHGAASLFRAAGRAEQIHAANHARVIRQLDGKATRTIHTFKIGSTIENLKDALAGETHEVEKMYPEFIAEATAAKNQAALRSFNYAIEAEKTHMRLYREAISLFESGAKGAWIETAREFYVCPVCGYTSETPEEHEHCPVCNALGTSFEVVN